MSTERTICILGLGVIFSGIGALSLGYNHTRRLDALESRVALISFVMTNRPAMMQLPIEHLPRWTTNGVVTNNAYANPPAAKP